MGIIIGTHGNDALAGTHEDDKIIALSGDDKVKAGEGNDVIYAGRGNDLVYGNGGNDKILGGKGNDSLFGNAGDDIIRGGAGNDALVGDEGNDRLYGGKGNDKLVDYYGKNLLMAGKGNDYVLTNALSSGKYNLGDGHDFLVIGHDYNSSIGSVTPQGSSTHIVKLGKGDDTLLVTKTDDSVSKNTYVRDFDVNAESDIFILQGLGYTDYSDFWDDVTFTANNGMIVHLETKHNIHFDTILDNSDIFFA